MNTIELFNQNKYIFSDFDGTISKYDVIHSFITNFSKGDWTIAEKQWCEGKLSTKDCLKIQFDLITGLKKSVFDEFINSIEIDPYFIDFYKYAKLKNKEIIVISDGFDLFIKPTLQKHKMDDIKVYSNVLILNEKDDFLTFSMEYPNMTDDCLIGSGTCKCDVAKKYSNNFTYIGDGMSDRCIAKKADLLFAKKGLETFCRTENISYIGYETFKDILDAIYSGANI